MEKTAEKRFSIHYNHLSPLFVLSLNVRCYSNNQQTVSHFRIKDNGNMKRFQVGKFDSMNPLLSHN